MLDALSVVLNMGALALERNCLYTDARILSYRQRALESAQQVLDLQPRSREAKGVVAHMHSALAQTYAALNQAKDAREAFLNAYRLRVELADTDPSNQFYAAQVMKSRLDIQQLRTHDPESSPQSFTEREALADLNTEQGRQKAKEAGLEALWLLGFIEYDLTRENDTAKALELTRELLSYFENSAMGEGDLLGALNAEALWRSLTKSTNEQFLTLGTLTLPKGQDCRSRFTRRLWHSLTGDSDLAAQELEGIRARGVTYPAMPFYEGLIEKMDGS